MLQIERAFLFDFWRRNRAVIFIFWLLQVGLALLISPVMRDLDAGGIAFFHVFMLGLVLMGLGIPIAGQCLSESRARGIGFPSRFFALPLPTWRLVLIQMLIGMMAMVILTALAIAIVRLRVPGQIWPGAGPFLFILMTMSLIQAVMWSVPNLRYGRPLIAISLWISMFRWLLGRFTEHEFRILPHNTFMHPWDRLTSSEFAFMILCILLAYVVSVAGVARDRRGDTQPGKKPEFLVGMKSSDRTRELRPFRSPLSAHFWYEWRIKGWFLPAGVAMFMLPPLAIGFWQGRSPDNDITETLIGILVFGIIIGALPAGLLIGSTDPRKKMPFGLGTFVATRPLWDRQLTISNFLVGFASIGMTILLGGAIILIWTGWLALIDRLDPVFHLVSPSRKELHWMQVAGAILSTWALLGFGIALSMFGRARVLAWFFGSLLALFFFFLLLDKTDLDRTALGLAMILTFALPIVTAGIYHLAARRRLIPLPILILAFLIWIVICFVASGFDFWDEFSRRPRDFSMFCGVLSLTLAPIALAPLAMHFNRHR